MENLHGDNHMVIHCFETTNMITSGFSDISFIHTKFMFFNKKCKKLTKKPGY